MWDEGLKGRFCSECFDHVVDAEEFLASQGLSHPGPEQTQRTPISSHKRPFKKRLGMRKLSTGRHDKSSGGI